ncbi:hypothetical protein JK386_07995 [Nocardioides sp. zg-536]|uniref:Chitin-binding type-3 domain-containing protein n=1 Tax=Nocardioides faecalis TaxID=2803858 RepID=A0A938Y9Q8_9ACTN|nr:carbohydrate-binding protein [Nocardioides faecalis]MBM9459844.1 hypothetical protein [Nocardioides faecalis]QVI58916.1 hypothetical protein KG111_00480 [Nocardioides faecalis]
MALVEGRRLSWVRLGIVLVTTAAVAFASLEGWRWFQDSRVKLSTDVWFAGYVDVTATPTLAFEEPDTTAEGAAAPNAVLAFVVADRADPCRPSWGAAYTLDEAEDQLDLDRRIARLRQLGGAPIVSFGGQANTELAVGCTDVDALYDAYREVVRRYSGGMIDLDIEGAALEDAEANQRRAEAVVRLQEAEDTEVWVTLPVAPHGLTESGLALVRTMIRAGVDLAGVNVMTMDYGGSKDAEDSMAQASIKALESTHAQLGELYVAAGDRRTEAQLWRLLGATPMLGQNDVVEEVFTLADAERLRDFADEKKLGRVSAWSLNRDRPCSNNWPDPTKVSDSCSGVRQAAGDFAAVLGEEREGVPQRAVVPSATPSPTQVPSPGATPTDDPETSPYQIWDPEVVYQKEERVVWRRNVYVAKWWTSGDVPDDPTIEDSASAWRLIGPVLPGERPQPTPKVPEGTYPMWRPGKVYRAGSQVQLDGVAYVALWWTRGTSPDQPSTADAPSPWRRLSAAELASASAEPGKKPRQRPSESPGAGTPGGG